MRINWQKEQEELVKKLEEERLRKMNSKMKKKEKIKIRNDHLDEIEEEFEDVAIERVPQKRTPTVRELLMTPMGVVALVGFSACAFVLIAYVFFDPYGTETQKKKDAATAKEMPAATSLDNDIDTASLNKKKSKTIKKD